MQSVADYTALDAELAEEPANGAETYTAESWAAYQEVLDSAEALSRNLLARNQEEVDELVETLKTAREALAEAPSETPTATPSAIATPSTSLEASATPDVKPEIILEGTDKAYTKGTNATVSVHCTSDLEDLIGVKMDGKEVEEANYTLKKGSTIVTFKTEYLETLSAGEHTVTLLYAGGRSVDSTLTILAAVDDSTDDTQDDASNEDNHSEEASADTVGTTPVTEASGPNTGDESNLLLYMMLLVAAIGACTYWAIKRKKAE